MISPRISTYAVPAQWLRYDIAAVAGELVEARTAAGVLTRLPYLPAWIDQALEEQLRLEAVGTSRIEGAEFTPREQDEALSASPETVAGLTHSQRQLWAADSTYRWLRRQPADRPVGANLIRDIHRRIVTGCDDDHCEPGELRRAGANVTFGSPVCRGAEGGAPVAEVFGALCAAFENDFQGHDRIIQALAAHYHFGAMHPFDDGNGRTARAAEAFMLRAAGVNDMVMVSLSNYYYEHKNEYLAAMYESRTKGHDLTPFLRFALRAVADGCNALADEITVHSSRTLYREFAHSLFGRLRSPRRRALGDRQLRIINILLDRGPQDVIDFVYEARPLYVDLKFPDSAMWRDLGGLLALGAITLSDRRVDVNLDWPRQASDSELLRQLEGMSAAATASHPAMAELTRLLGRR